MKWIILDFGARHLKALLTQIDAQKIKVQDFAQWPTKAEFFEGLEFPTTAAWSALSVGINEHGWLVEESTAVSAQLPSTYLETRYLRFPFKGDRKVEKVLPMEIESAIPFDVDEILLRSRILSGAGVEQTAESLVFVMAYKRELIKKYETELQIHQPSIPSVSVDILCLSALRSAVPASPVMGFLSFGHRKTQFLLIQASGTVLAARTFFWGGSQLHRKLQSSLQCDEAKAQELLENKASFEITKDSQAIHVEMASALEESLNLFMNEFRQSIKSFQQQGLQIPRATPIWMVGKLAQIPGFKTRMIERYKNEFDFLFELYPWQNLQKSVEGLDRLEDPMAALPAIAQALSQTRPHRSKIQQFSESNFQFQQNLKKIRTESTRIARRVAMIVLAPLIYLLVSFGLQQRESAQLDAQLSAQLEEAQVEVAPGTKSDMILKLLKKQLNENQAKIARLEEDQHNPLFILSDLSRAIPLSLKVDMQEFRVSDDRVQMTARVKGSNASQDLVTQIQTVYPGAVAGQPKACESGSDCQLITIEFNRVASVSQEKP